MAPINHIKPVSSLFSKAITRFNHSIWLRPPTTVFATRFDLAYPFHGHGEVQVLPAFYVKGYQAYQTAFPIEETHRHSNPGRQQQWV